MPLRAAISILIGVGIGCDEAGDEPDATARPKLEAVQRTFLEKCSTKEIDKAFRTVFDVDDA